MPSVGHLIFYTYDSRGGPAFWESAITNLLAT